jgi:hypothetical protein
MSCGVTRGLASMPRSHAAAWRAELRCAGLLRPACATRCAHGAGASRFTGANMTDPAGRERALRNAHEHD